MNRFKQNRKRNMIVILPLTIMLIMMFVVNMIEYSMQEYINNIQDNIDLRSIKGLAYNPTTYEETVKKICSIEHVEMVVGQDEDRVIANEICEQFKYNRADGSIILKSINQKVCPEVIRGRKIEENDEYCVIVPSKIYAGELRKYNDPILEHEYIEGAQFIGQKITIEFSVAHEICLEREFEVVGIYDSTKYNENNILYVPIHTIKKLNEDVGYQPDFFQMSVVVDKIENVDKVKNELYSKNIIQKSAIQQELQEMMGGEKNTQAEANISVESNISLDTINIIKKLIVFLLVTSTFILVITLIVTNLNKTYLQTTELGIYKIQGYTNKDIQEITIIENIFVCVISSIIALIGFEMGKLLMNNVFSSILNTETIGITANKIKQEIYYITQIPQKINPLFVIGILCIIVLIISISTYFTNKRILKKPIKNMLEN